MAQVAYYPHGVVLTRDTVTWDLRTLQVWCHKWSDFTGRGPKRGANRTVPQQNGTARRDRYRGELRGVLHITIDGAWQEDSTAYAGDRLANAHTAMQSLLDFLDVNDPCTIDVHQPGSLPVLTGTLQVEDPGPPTFDAGRFVYLAVDATVHTGLLTPAGS
jgi:hypothetical protein